MSENNEKTQVKTAEKASVETAPPVVGTPKKKPAILATGIVVGALALMGLGIGGGVLIEQGLGTTSIATPSLSSGGDGNTTITQEESTIAAVAEKVEPSVVSIVTETQIQSYYGTTSGEGAGTGIIVSEDGYVMTNNHVIDGATTVSVIDSEGALYDDVEVIGRDPLNDIAFLKINSTDTFTPAELGNSSSIRVGQQVVAIGNALGQYSNTVTSGIVSGTGRPVTASSGYGDSESLTDLIQTDASINSGNSGGPLVNMSGQVIGINTAIVEDANGIGFSIPINSTKGVLAEVLATGEVSRAYLGVNYLSITPDVAREYDLPVNYGAYVYASQGANAVASGSPAAEAGLQTNDIILKINDETIGEDGGLSSIIGQYRPGDIVTITYLRDGKEATTKLTLGTYS
tara:strand:- start:12477 stop:13682 length:1206 start_codon:yes stop_codon:yes gene_type:complete